MAVVVTQMTSMVTKLIEINHHHKYTRPANLMKHIYIRNCYIVILHNISQLYK